MLYSRHITTPANTAEASSTKTYMKVHRGWIYSVWVTFPPGCAGLLKMRIYHEGHPFLPVEQNEYLNGDSVSFEFPVYYPITDEPERLTIETWNEDDTYSHAIQVLIMLLPKKFIMPMGSTEGIMESLKSLILRPIIMRDEELKEET